MTGVGIFARPPRAGKVKTRMIPDIGAANAAAVYRRCLAHALKVAHQSKLSCRLFLSESGDDPLFDGIDVTLQQGADLGARMHRALDELLSGGCDGAILIGTDCLDLKAAHLIDAAKALSTHDLVITPAADGGFVLIGCTRITPKLFDGVEWSSARVLGQTLENARNLGYRTHRLATLRDIDTLRDLECYPELVALIETR